MLITMHEQLGLQQTHHDQACVIIPQWVYKTLEAFQLPFTAAIDYSVLSQYMSHQDMVDYLLLTLHGRSIFTHEYGLFDQKKDRKLPSCDPISPYIALTYPFHEKDALKLLGSIDSSTHSEQHDMRYENSSDAKEIFWGSFIQNGDDHQFYEIAWQIQDLGYRPSDQQNPHNLNHVIGIIARQLVLVDEDTSRLMRQKLRRDLLEQFFNSGISLETLAYSGLMDRYIRCFG